MNKRYWLGGLVLVMCGCSSMNNTERGALTGGVLGAGLGTVIGGIAGDPGAGAAIGAGAGAILGGVAGNDMDKAERRAEAQAAAAAAQVPPISEVVRMAHNHVSDDLIIQQIRSTNTVYNLSGQDVTYLKQQGLSDRVVSEMMQTRRTATVVVPRSHVVVVEPPPPPVSVGIGYTFGRRRCY